jgi:hypothetical protein
MFQPESVCLVLEIAQLPDASSNARGEKSRQNRQIGKNIVGRHGAFSLQLGGMPPHPPRPRLNSTMVLLMPAGEV